MVSKDKPTILIIIGVTGDLSKRYLLKAVNELITPKSITEKFKVIGTSRQSNIDTKDLFKNITEKNNLINNFEIFTLNPINKEDYLNLEKRIEEIEKNIGNSQRIFYFSVPPNVTQTIIKFLGE